MSPSSPLAITATAGADANEETTQTISARNATNADFASTNNPRASDIVMSDVNLEAATTIAIIEPLPNFDDLASELKLEIIKYLPIRQILKLRETCKVLHALVDEYSDTISRARVNISLAKLVLFNKTHISYNAKTVDGESAFMKALTASVHLRGIAMSSHCSNWLRLVRLFVNEWRYRLTLAKGAESFAGERSHQHKIDNDDEDDALMDIPLEAAVHDLAQLHIHFHVKNCESNEQVARHQNGWLAVPPWSVGLESASQMNEVLQEIEKGSWKAAKVAPERSRLGCYRGPCAVNAPPSLYSIDRALLLHSVEADDEEASTSVFERILGIPMSLLGTPFQYFLKSEWAFIMITNAMHSRINLSSLQKAAILEEVVVY